MVRRLLYSTLGFEKYLQVLSWGYFASFRLGLLKTDPLYRYPYLVKDVVKAGDVVIDLGANLGYFTRLFAQLVGDEGMVYAVEPIAPILKILRKNVRNAANVEILPYALGTEDKEISMGGRKGLQQFIRSGGHVVLDELSIASSEADYSFKAEMRRGSELFADLQRLDFIKCDIEGFETVVLTEMIDVIGRHMPMLLVEARRQSRGKIVELLYPLGYVGLEFDGDRLVELGRRTSDRYGDMLFVTKETLGRIPADALASQEITFPADSLPDMSPDRLGTPI